MPRKYNDPFKHRKTGEIEELVTRNSKHIDRIADDLLLIAKSDATKDALFKIKELALCNVTVIDYPGLGI